MLPLTESLCEKNTYLLIFKSFTRRSTRNTVHMNVGCNIRFYYFLINVIFVVPAIYKHKIHFFSISKTYILVQKLTSTVPNVYLSQ